MIIKLVPIKTKAKLGNVINYIATDKGRIEDYKKQGVFHNVKSLELGALRKEFESNYDEYANKRSNGNIAMHIIQSVSPLDRDKMNLEMMDDITSTFLNKAYPNALGFGAHHKEQSHWHTHTIVSANELMSKQSTRLSKEKLFEVHKFMLDYIHEKYPELKTTIDISNWGKRLQNEKTYYMKKRNPDFKLTKEEVQEKVQDLFRTCESSKQFFALLEFDGFKTYTYKENIQGIYFGVDEKKMRFSRLGIEKEQIAELDKQYERLQELEKLNAPAKTMILDHYTYDMYDISGSPTGINADLENENELEIADSQLETEFEEIMNYPIQEAVNELIVDNQLKGFDIDTEQDNDKSEIDSTNSSDIDSTNDIEPSSEQDEDKNGNDINDLEIDAQNDLDADNDVEMDSEP